MTKEIHIDDQSGDKNYFTIVPNYILNHSTAADQALYLQMKRIAGDGGVCEAGYRYFTEQLGIGYKRYKKSLDYLLAHEWVSYVGKKRVVTEGGIQDMHTYRVNNIWPLNNAYYKGGAKQNHPKVVSEGGLGWSQKDVQGGAKRKQKKNYKKNYKKNQSSSFKKKKPFYEAEEGLLEMRRRKNDGKWFCIPAGGGEWLEFTGKESDIVWKTQ